MNAAEHRKHAKSWLSESASLTALGNYPAALALAAIAQVHATLAAIPDAQTERVDHAAAVAAQEAYEYGVSDGGRPMPDYTGERL